MSNRKRKVLFAFDGYIYTDNKGSHYGVHVNEAIKQRYLHLGDHVSFLMRGKKLEAGIGSSNFSPINSEKFSFIEVPNFKTIRTWIKNKKRAIQLINTAVLEHDIIIARLPTAIGRLAILAARKYNKPHMVEFVGCTFDAYWNYNWQGKLIAHYKLAQMRKLVNDVPYIMYVTKEFLQNRYPSRGKQIQCSNVELEGFNQIDLDNRLRRIKHSNIQEMTLCTIAAIDVPYKGQDDVIEAIGILNRKMGWNLQYKIIGQGNPTRLNNLARKHGISDSVNIIGSIPHSEIFDHLRDIDLYIQPSKQEGLPRALIEAMSVACPALGAKTAGIPELLIGEAIFPAGKILNIVNRVRSIDKKWLKNQAKNNFEVAQEYQKHYLERKRKDFYQDFLNDTTYKNR